MCYNAITGSAPSYLSELPHLSALPALSALHQTHACSNSNASTAKHMAFAPSHTSLPTYGTISPKTPGTLLLSPFLQKTSGESNRSRPFTAYHYQPNALPLGQKRLPSGSLRLGQPNRLPDPGAHRSCTMCSCEFTKKSCC